jgi:hypothetical protein
MDWKLTLGPDGEPEVDEIRQRDENLDLGYALMRDLIAEYDRIALGESPIGVIFRKSTNEFWI